MESNNYVLTCNKIDSMLHKQLKRVELGNLNCTVQELATSIAQCWKVDSDTFEIVCYGKYLDPSKTLDTYGIEAGTLLYMLKKKKEFVEALAMSPEKEKEATTSSGLSTEAQGMCIALKSALLNSSFRHVVENLVNFDNRENLMTINSQLRSDPSLFGMLTDYDLLNLLMTRNNIKLLLKRYPHFLDIATQVSATFHEELNTNTALNNIAYRGLFPNYSIDAISEDEEMDESDASSVSSTNTNTSNRRPSDGSSFSSMLMQAYQNRNNANNAVITQDMLRQALQQASTSQSGPSASQSSASTSQSSSRRPSQSSQPFLVPAPPGQPRQSNEPPAQPTTAQILIGYAPQLRQMRELGIMDDIVAIQALEATNGDVQAAINIIFSDFS